MTKNIEMLASHIIVIRASQKTTWNKQQHLYKIGLSYICGDTRKGQKKNCGFPGNAIHSEVSNYLNPSSLSDYTIPISKNLHPGKKSNLIPYQCVVEFNKL